MAQRVRELALPEDPHFGSQHPHQAAYTACDSSSRVLDGSDFQRVPLWPAAPWRNLVPSHSLCLSPGQPTSHWAVRTAETSNSTVPESQLSTACPVVKVPPGISTLHHLLYNDHQHTGARKSVLLSNHGPACCLSGGAFFSAPPPKFNNYWICRSFVQNTLL